MVRKSMDSRCNVSHNPWTTANAVGGFAGGELGLQQFVKEGDVKIAEGGMCAHSCVTTLPHLPQATCDGRARAPC